MNISRQVLFPNCSDITKDYFRPHKLAACKNYGYAYAPMIVLPTAETHPTPRALNPPVSIPLTLLPSHPCPYLPDRTATYRAMLAGSLPDDFYRGLMDVGLRRSGRLIYQPVCDGCRECVPIRVPVQMFEPSVSQRRCRRRNVDLQITLGPPVATDEKFDLYQRYQRDWHHGEPQPAEDARDSFESFLYESPVPTIEFSYRTPDDRLLAVGICDIDSCSLSSVYFYFDPVESKRSLGTFGALIELAWAKRSKLKWYYLGFWVNASDAMRYKNRFRPHQLLDTAGTWYDIV